MVAKPNQPKTAERKSNDQELLKSKKGNISPQLILGIGVLVIIAPVILKVGAQIYTSFSSTSVFSPIWSAVIAILFMAAMVAAVLGAE